MKLRSLSKFVWLLKEPFEIMMTMKLKIMIRKNVENE